MEAKRLTRQSLRKQQFKPAKHILSVGPRQVEPNAQDIVEAVQFGAIDVAVSILKTDREVPNNVLFAAMGRHVAASITNLVWQLNAMTPIDVPQLFGALLMLTLSCIKEEAIHVARRVVAGHSVEPIAEGPGGMLN